MDISLSSFSGIPPKTFYFVFKSGEQEKNEELEAVLISE